MGDLSPVRLSKLIPVLGSDKDGEIIAAAAAISRCLDAAGRDWHDIAAATVRGWPVSAVVEPQTVILRDWQNLARKCQRAGIGTLTEAELDFLRNILGRHTEPSQKQWRWLTAIAQALKIEVMA